MATRRMIMCTACRKPTGNLTDGKALVPETLQVCGDCRKLKEPTREWRNAQRRLTRPRITLESLRQSFDRIESL